MGLFLEQLDAWSSGWVEVMWAVCWQSALLALAVWGIALMLRRSSPAVRYWLWQIVAIKLLLMPFWTLAIPLPSFFETVPEEPASQAADNVLLENIPDPNLSEIADGGPSGSAEDLIVQAEVALPAWYERLSWQSWLLVVWGTAILLQVVRVVWLRVRLGRMLGKAAVASGELAALLKNSTELLGLKKVPRVVLTEFDCSPFVCGIIRPVVVLPESLAGSFEPERMRQVLLHELAHVKRLDLIWSWIPEVARTVYFFNPVVHWVNARVRLERELSCDQLAMAYSGQDAAGYAETLVKVVSHTSEPAVLKTAAATSAGIVDEGKRERRGETGRVDF